MTLYKRNTAEPDIIIGYTTRRHLLLDLDDTTYTKASRLAELIMREYPEVGDCLIVESSCGKDTETLKYDNFKRPYHTRDRLNIHLIFDNLIGYNKACKIINTLAELHILNKGYNDIRQFRGDLTLRTSPKVRLNEAQPYPEPIGYKCNKYKKKKGHYIAEYLRFLDFCLSLSLPRLITNGSARDSTKSSDGGTQSHPVDTTMHGETLHGDNTND